MDANTIGFAIVLPAFIIFAIGLAAAWEVVSQYHRAGRVYEGQRHAGSGSLSDILPFRRPTGR